jgi:heat shock protein HslJ
MKGTAIVMILLMVVLGASLFWWRAAEHGVSAPATLDHLNAEYAIDGLRIRLRDGRSELEAAPGSASKIITRYFGNEAWQDLNGDGAEDVVFVLTQSTGGSGTFYYVVAAISTASGSQGSDGVLLGDRIAPQTTEIGPNSIVMVNYADRAPGESFATPPSQGKSVWLKLDLETLQFAEVAQDFEGEADPSRMTLGMHTWTWIKTTYSDGREVLPAQTDAFVLTFQSDGRFSATTDCNRVGGSYATRDRQLSFGPIMATRMYCEGAQEAEFTDMLASASTYEFTSRGLLILHLGQGGGAAEFR